MSSVSAKARATQGTQLHGWSPRNEPAQDTCGKKKAAPNPAPTRADSGRLRPSSESNARMTATNAIGHQPRAGKAAFKLKPPATAATRALGIDKGRRTRPGPAKRGRCCGGGDSIVDAVISGSNQPLPARHSSRQRNNQAPVET